MKLKYFAFLFFFSGAANAEVKLACQSFFANALLDSSYILRENESNFELLVQYGVRGVPIDADPLSVVRTGDLEGIKERAEVFGKLPNEFKLEFDKSDCKFETANSEIHWNCYIRKPGQLGNLEYQGFAFFVYSQNIQSPWSAYRIYNVGIEFNVPLKPGWSRNMTAVVTYENSGVDNSCYIPSHGQDLRPEPWIGPPIK